jgi:hypothetical protein
VSRHTLSLSLSPSLLVPISLSSHLYLSPFPIRSALRDVQSLNQQVNDLARDNIAHIERHDAVKEELARAKEALKAAGDEGADAAALRVKARSLQDKTDLLEQLMEQASLISYLFV